MKKKIFNAITFFIGYIGFYIALLAVLSATGLLLYHLAKQLYQWL